jgi:hypothetical protein
VTSAAALVAELDGGRRALGAVADLPAVRARVARAVG